MNVSKATFIILALMVPLEARSDDAVRLSARDAEIIFEDPGALEASRLVQAGEFQKARSALLSLGRPEETPAHMGRLRFLLAHVLLELEEWGTAAAVLDGLEKDIPVVKDRVLFMRGTALAALGSHRQATADLAGIPEGSAVLIPALLRMGNYFLEQDLPAAAVGVFQRAYDAGRRGPSVIGRLARALIQADREDEAEALLRRSYFRFAVSGRASFRRMLRDLGATLDPTDNERLTRARALMDIHRNEEAIGEARIPLKSADQAIRCGANLVTGKALSKLRRHGKALPFFRKALEECRDGGDLAYARFNAVRSANRSGRTGEGDEHAEALALEFPASSLNDDVAIWRARRALSSGRTTLAETILTRSLDLWPQGDMSNESRWLLAWGAIRSRDYAKAMTRLSSGLESAGDDPDYGSRFAYWRARVLDITGDRTGALEAYLACARDYPMVYYGFLALNRLGASRVSGVKKQLSLARTQPSVGPFLWLKDGRTVREGAVARALWLAQTGLTDLAAREAAALDAPNPDEGWVAALLLEAGERYTRSHRAADRVIRTQGGFWPDRDTMDYYRLAYPLPYREIVERAARESAVDPFLIWAVMRVESAFVAGVESRSNAIGLMQLIMPTARAMAKRLDLTASEKTLRRPEINVRLGARYLSRLLKRFKEPVLAIPGYNAGGGAISRWLKSKRGVPLDAFVESIAARETRNYARKVFQAWAAYRFLYEKGDRRYTTIRFQR